MRSLPPNFYLSETKESLVIVRKWRERVDYINLLMVFFLGIIPGAGLYGFLYYKHTLANYGEFVLAISILIFSWFIFLWFCYYTLALLFNRTKITLRISESKHLERKPYREIFTKPVQFLSIRHKPFPWPGNRSFFCTHLDEILIEKKRYPGVRKKMYCLKIKTQSGQKITVLNKIPSLDYASDFKQVLVQKLRITNQIVSDEGTKS